MLWCDVCVWVISLRSKIGLGVAVCVLHSHCMCCAACVRTFLNYKFLPTMAKKKQLSEEDKAKIIALGKAAEAEVEVAPKTDPSNAPLQETARSADVTCASCFRFRI